MRRYHFLATELPNSDGKRALVCLAVSIDFPWQRRPSMSRLVWATISLLSLLVLPHSDGAAVTCPAMSSYKTLSDCLSAAPFDPLKRDAVVDSLQKMVPSFAFI